MNITHHLTDETLLEYASGSLTEALEVVVASHLTLCSHCHQRSIFADDVGGYLLANAPSSSVSLTAEQVLEKIGSREQPDPTKQQNAGTYDKSVNTVHTEVPRPLARRLPNRLDELPWKKMAKGIKQFDLGSRKLNDGAFKLLKLEPGVRIVEHSHGGHELTLVLRGSYTDVTGRFGVGDIADLGEDVTHCPIIDEHEPCIALLATSSPAKYTGLLGKLMQPFIGI